METDALKARLTLVQATVTQLQAMMDNACAKQKLRNTGGPTTSELLCVYRLASLCQADEKYKSYLADQPKHDTVEYGGTRL